MRFARVIWTVERGEYVSIAGPSGCGKSTLLSILGLLDTPSGGDYLLNGRAGRRRCASAERARVRNREIGFIFQSFNLIGDLTVFENVELPLTYRGMRGAERPAARHGGARAGRHGPPRQAPAQPAVRRPAAARRRGARRRRRPGPAARRRADRQPRFEERRSGDGPAARAAPERRHHLHGHPRPALRAPRRIATSTCSTGGSSISRSRWRRQSNHPATAAGHSPR